jgi:hypothetical protein
LLHEFVRRILNGGAAGGRREAEALDTARQVQNTALKLLKPYLERG